MTTSPALVCLGCAVTHGGNFPRGKVAPFQYGTCEVCGCSGIVAEPPEFGNPVFTPVR